MSGKVSFSLVLCAASLVAIVSIASAGSTNYGDYEGTAPSDVDFLSVAEASSTDDVPLFGTPTRSENSLWFYPATFASEASDGASDTTAGTLTMTIRADEGCYLTEVIINEFGLYSLAGNGDSGTSASVNGTLWIDTGSQIFSVVLDVTPDSPYVLPPECSHEFFGSATINLPAGVSQVSFSFEDILATTSQAGTTAFIQKSVFSGPIIGIAVIPEPTTMALLFGGTLALLRRKKV
jgi:hypothetical protein